MHLCLNKSIGEQQWSRDWMTSASWLLSPVVYAPIIALVMARLHAPTTDAAAAAAAAAS